MQLGEPGIQTSDLLITRLYLRPFWISEFIKTCQQVKSQLVAKLWANSLFNLQSWEMKQMANVVVSQTAVPWMATWDWLQKQVSPHKTRVEKPFTAEINMFTAQ